MRLNPILVLCMLITACAKDPIDNPGTWRVPPKGLTSNDENLRAMLVNPRDLVGGTGERTASAVTAASAVRRELSGHRANLPQSRTSSIGTQTGQQQQPQQQQNAETGAAGRQE